MGEHGHALGRGWLAAKGVAQATDRDDQEGDTDSDAAVIVNARRMPEQPDCEEQHDHGQRERHAAHEPTEGIRVERDRDRVVGIEPLDDGADDREDEDQKRDSVTPLVFGECLFAQHAEGSPGRVSESEPRSCERAVLLDDDLLSPRESLCRLRRSSAPGRRRAGTRGRLGARSHAVHGTRGLCQRRGTTLVAILSA